MLEPELVRGSPTRTGGDRVLAGRLQHGASGIARWGTGRPKNLPRPTVVEKTVASPPWKTLRVSHFPPASTTAALFRSLQWNPKLRRLRYDWTQNGGQVKSA